MANDNKLEETKNTLLNNKWIVLIVLLFLIVAGLGTLTDSIEKIGKFTGKIFSIFNEQSTDPYDNFWNEPLEK